MAEVETVDWPSRDAADTDTLAPERQPARQSAIAGEARLPISVFIIAKNEADRIARTIRSVRDWVDEVIVIDSGSSDATVDVSRALDARTEFRAWTGYGPQKRYGEGLCRNTWLLNLDADEEVPPAAAREIKALFRAGEPKAKAYTVWLKSVFRFEERPNFFAVSTTQVRLYDKRYACFSDSPVHDSVRVTPGVKIGRLKAALWHRSMRSHHHTVEKINFYSSMQAEDLFGKQRRFGAARIVATPLWAFFKAYLLRGYLFYGVEGIIQSYLYAFSRFIRAAKARERFQEDRHRHCVGAAEVRRGAWSPSPGTES